MAFTSSSIAFFTTRSDLTPGSASSWVEIDLNTYLTSTDYNKLPNNTEAIILHVTGDAAKSDFTFGCRDCDDDASLTERLYSDQHNYFISRVAKNGSDHWAIDLYVGDTNLKVYAVGYMTSDAVHMYPDKDGHILTLPAGAVWDEVTVAAEEIVEGDVATGIIIEVQDLSANALGIRYCYGSWNDPAQVTYHTQLITYLHTNRQFDGYFQGILTKDVYLVGYFKNTGNVTFKTTPTTINPASVSTWSTIDIPSVGSLPTNPVCTGIILLTGTNVGSYDWGVRKKGVTASEPSDLSENRRQHIAIVETNSSGEVELYHANANLTSYLVGWIGSSSSSSSSLSSSSSSRSSSSSSRSSSSSSSSSSIAVDTHIWGEETPTSGEFPRSWQNWNKQGGGALTVWDDDDWGTLVFTLNETILGEVMYLPEGVKTINITTNNYGIGEGNYAIYIRGSATSFLFDASSPTWYLYTIPVNKDWRYLQIKLVDLQG